jgi:hypothetical protein
VVDEASATERVIHKARDRAYQKLCPDRPTQAVLGPTAPVNTMIPLVTAFSVFSG